ncbi:MAG: DMT family transporter [Betaproteobacteria bacterium]|nr:DMT family transporter [Betaproteobacteria bacterium]
MSSHPATLPRSTWLLLAMLTLGWGMNWPMIKMAVAEVPVWTFRGICVWGGAIGLFAIARFSATSLHVPRKHWGPLLLMSLCNVTLWNVLVTYGIRMLPAGRSAILAYTMPLWTVLFSTLILHEKLTVRRVAGIVLGMSGLGLLLTDSIVAIGGRPLGALLIVSAAICWSMGTVLMKKIPLGMSTTSFTAWNFLLGGVPIVAGALILDPPHWRPIGPWAVTGLVYNVFVAFILCHWIWFRIVSLAPAGVSALGTLSIPVVAVFSGMAILGEKPDWTEICALGLILAALATVLVPSRSQPPASQTAAGPADK